MAAAARRLPEPAPTAVLGIDETRFQSVRWILDGTSWRPSDPWMTSFVDCTPGHPGPLLGLTPVRSGGCVRDCLGVQSDAFRRRIEIVVIDPSAPYESGIRAALPGVKIAVDQWHHVAVANTMVTEVRQRLTRNLLGRRGTTADPIGLNRHILLTGAEHLSSKQWNRLWRSFDACDPIKEVQAAWAATNASDSSSVNTNRRGSDGDWPTSTRPPSMLSSPKRPASPARSRPGGPPSSSPSSRTCTTPEPKGSTAHQTSKENWLRLPKHDQLPAAYPHPHRGHPTTPISSMNGDTTPLQLVEPQNQTREVPGPRPVAIGLAWRCSARTSRPRALRVIDGWHGYDRMTLWTLGRGRP